MNYIIYSATEKDNLIGAKAKTLFDLQRHGFLIPQGFVVSINAWSDSLTPEQDFNIQLHPTVKEEIQQAVKELCPNGELLAVRSSAIDEDGGQYSFAGQLDSFLNVTPEDVAAKVIEVWRSGFSQRVFAYRRQHNLPLIASVPAVLIQRMVNPSVSGVAFGADPVTGKRSIAVVNAVSGLPTSLVSGESNADTYYIDIKGNITQHQTEQLLNNEQITQIATLVRQVGKHFGRPQDIEWAIEDKQLYLLQSRPITTLAQIPDPDGLLNLWDNSNIAESYNGVTTPLTFSFARKAYEEVYRQFCYFMGVPQTAIARHHDTFARMIGLIRGRVYYNLLSWYRVLALLPGFRLNRGFMEQMMGVKESLPENIVSELQAATWQDKLQDSWRLLKTCVGLVTNYILLPKRIQKFYLRLENALYLSEPNLANWRADELAAYYRKIEGQLLSRWDAPLINDFFAMIFYGVLRRLTEKWCDGQLNSLQNDLISGEGKIISTEPAERMQKMASSVRENVFFVKLLCEGSLDEILQAMKELPFQAQYQEYLGKFGDRCLEELKLESPTLHDQPLPLLRAIGQLAMLEQRSTPNNRYKAEHTVSEVLKAYPLRKFVYNWVLKNTRIRVRERENLRFERTRVFGRARLVFVELGRRFYALDLLASPQDIFYLEVNEILGFIEGTTTCTDLKGLVGLRRVEFAKYKEMAPPDSRFETRGIIYQGNSFVMPVKTTQSELVSQKQGIGCSGGIVRGCVRVITDPKQVLSSENKTLFPPNTVLVAERTDPGWILLFPFAAGLLVECGSLLSHAAIVSRELGIPAITSVPGVTQWLKDGDYVEMDGSTGIISLISMPCGTGVSPVQ
ncbi:pyruvate, water dikinase [Dulcicalothrix desertica PCC 7102]|uniref:Pyruvate, water dikinase n=1 Tax=Dulcicalothrix desertica PCC 7102 TaxID=232991 RepID=A0A3S1C6A8_9CYAN|nr:PEP/pyruvate-binding domain-containing protein [Dulcicalothrix desertica]RUS97368.1 pyruvate, water dikinase [Dulcicalothrix desertica PCC 7102]TWH55546.1 pyruvate,water dikinase [Dulcicalothrix desertica PCC 7102]